VNRDGANLNSDNQETPEQRLAGSYYALLGLSPSASAQQIRRAYREMSKLYHPDTTTLPATVAIAKFQELNEAYATLSSPERRFAYDLKIGYSRVSVIQSSTDLNRSSARSRFRSAYLDPTDRPLSPGEVFALFILGVTFVGCLILAVAIGLTRGEIAFQPFNPTQITQETPHLPQPEQLINSPQITLPNTSFLKDEQRDNEKIDEEQSPHTQPATEFKAAQSEFTGYSDTIDRSASANLSSTVEFPSGFVPAKPDRSTSLNLSPG
jgi:curved DNA-binding protein CbpA